LTEVLVTALTFINDGTNSNFADISRDTSKVDFDFFIIAIAFASTVVACVYDESLFQQQIEAVNGEGDCLLAPTLDGDMQIIDVGNQQYTLSDGAFVAAQTGVDIRANIQRNLGGAVFGDTGGFMVMQTQGQGQVVVSGFGSLFEIDVTPEKDVIIDNGHVVCWDSNLEYKLSVSTSKKKGIMSSIINSVTSGEGMVLNFSGNGKVIICSRNRDSYQGWLQSILGSSSGGRGGGGGFLDNIL